MVCTEFRSDRANNTPPFTLHWQPIIMAYSVPKWCVFGWVKISWKNVQTTLKFIQIFETESCCAQHYFELWILYGMGCCFAHFQFDNFFDFNIGQNTEINWSYPSFAFPIDEESILIHFECTSQFEICIIFFFRPSIEHTTGQQRFRHWYLPIEFELFGHCLPYKISLQNK